VPRQGEWHTTQDGRDHWLPPSCYAAGVYGGQTWGKTVMPHELKREECDRIWVVVQATDKACAACGAS
jgi:hypothetical protein